MQHKFVSERFDYCWLLGDLNFRIEGEKNEVTKIVTEMSPNALDDILDMDEDLKHYKNTKVHYIYYLMKNDELRNFCIAKSEHHLAYGNIFEG